MSIKLKFAPVSHSWVALHPQPKGVIQFIGGAFFGTFGPMVFYRYLLQQLFNQGYTIILLPFNFTFDHYHEAGFLIQEQYEILPELVRKAILAGYDYQPYLNEKNFSWMAHSIGCKYVDLLEGFTELEKITYPPTEAPQKQKEDPQKLEEFIRKIVLETSKSSDKAKIDRKIQSIVTDLLILMREIKQKVETAKNLIQYYIEQHTKQKVEVEINSIFIKGQPSILLAPDNSGTSSAIKPKFFADIIDALGFGVKPSPEETFALIKDSNMFNLLGLVSFKSDTIAKSTVEWFIKDLKKPPQNLRDDLRGGHLRPLGVQIGKYVINFPDSFPIIQSAKKRSAEFDSYVIQLLASVEKNK